MYYKEIGVSRSLFVRPSITNCSCCNKRLEKQPHERENRQQVSKDSNSALLFNVLPLQIKTRNQYPAGIHILIFILVFTFSQP